MKMYKAAKQPKTTLVGNRAYEGETIEQKVNRIVNNKEPITDGAPLYYTERKDGVQPEYNIRTDRWEIAVDAMDAVSKSHVAKREERLKEMAERAKSESEKGKSGGGKETGGQSTQGTGEAK